MGSKINVNCVLFNCEIWQSEIERETREMEPRESEIEKGTRWLILRQRKVLSGTMGKNCGKTLDDTLRKDDQFLMVH